jgi:hypothetical protein
MCYDLDRMGEIEVKLAADLGVVGVFLRFSGGCGVVGGA